MTVGFQFLHPYEKVEGVLCDLKTDDGMLIAKMSGISVGLPINLEPLLKQHLGCRLGILRTDIPKREYLIRLLASSPSI